MVRGALRETNATELGYGLAYGAVGGKTLRVFATTSTTGHLDGKLVTSGGDQCWTFAFASYAYG